MHIHFFALFLFAVILLLVIYTFFGYAALLLVVSRRAKPRPTSDDDPTELPSATLIIPAYNEENDIRRKLENVLQLDYPSDRLRVIVASDASTDGTDAIVGEFAQKGIRLCRSQSRGGKVAAYKNAVLCSAGDILVFSDATSELEKDSLRRMLSHFLDPMVGSVAGRLFFVSKRDGGIGKGEKAYWDYNVRINDAEGRLASLTSVSGAFFAVRRRLFPVHMPADLAEDFIVPLNVVRQGYRTVLEPMAVCREVSVQSEGQEVRKRARITVQNIGGLTYGKDLLNVFKHGRFSLLLISHKLLRVLAPLMLAVLFLVNVDLARSSPLFRFLLAGQSAFYLLGLLTGVWREKRPRLMNLVYFFCLSNYAILLGIWMYFRGDRMATWETERA